MRSRSEKKTEYLIEERLSYRARTITAIIHRHGLVIGRSRVGWHLKHLNSIHTGRKGDRKKIPGILVVSKSNLIWETV